MDELRRLLDAAKKVGGDLRAPRNHDQTKDALGGGCISTGAAAAKRSLESCGLGTARPTNEWHLLILIGIYTGLRLGDCCRLDWSQINLTQGVIQLVPRKTRRHHQRLVTIPIHPTLGAALMDREDILSTPTPSTYTSGKVLPAIAEMYDRTRWQVNQELKRIFKAANIVTSIKIEGRKNRTPEATFHSLRHTFVSFSANAGVPLHIVQSIVGHESTAMTRHYYHESVDALRSAVTAIPSLG